LTGPIAKGEVDGRSALGSNLYFVPRGVNEQAISAAGLTMLVCQDRAEAVTEIAGAGIPRGSVGQQFSGLRMGRIGSNVAHGCSRTGK
jgi:hypothetical protein